MDLMARLDRRAVRTYGLDGDQDATVRDGQIVVLGDPILPVGEVRLPGVPMLHNVLAAALGARLVGARATSIAAAIREFRGVAHRLETVGEWGGVRFVNDSMATIPPPPSPHSTRSGSAAWSSSRAGRARASRSTRWGMPSPPAHAPWC